MTAAGQAFHRRKTVLCATPPGHSVHVPTGMGRMQGKIKGRDTAWRGKSACTWGWRGTRRIEAPCRMDCQCRASIGQSACIARRSQMALDGAST
jgi:hypothetical protein